MHYTAGLSAVLFAASGLSQSTVDYVLASRVSIDLDSLRASQTANPSYQSALSAVSSALPATAFAVLSDSPALFSSLAANAPTPASWAATFPTAALNVIVDIDAKPQKGQDDLGDYFDSVNTLSGLGPALATALPADAQVSAALDPAGYLLDLVYTAPLPAYVTALPAAPQSSFISVINKGLSILASDFETSSVPPRTTGAFNTGRLGNATSIPSRTSTKPASTGSRTGTPSVSFARNSTSTGKATAAPSQSCSACPSCPGTVTIISTVTAGSYTPRASSTYSSSPSSSSVVSYSSTRPLTQSSSAATSSAASTSSKASSGAPSASRASTTASSSSGVVAYNGTASSTNPLTFKGAAAGGKGMASAGMMVFGAVVAGLAGAV